MKKIPDLSGAIGQTRKIWKGAWRGTRSRAVICRPTHERKKFPRYRLDVRRVSNTVLVKCETYHGHRQIQKRVRRGCWRLESIEGGKRSSAWHQLSGGSVTFGKKQHHLDFITSLLSTTGRCAQTPQRLHNLYINDPLNVQLATSPCLTVSTAI